MRGDDFGVLVLELLFFARELFQGALGFFDAQAPDLVEGFVRGSDAGECVFVEVEVEVADGFADQLEVG